MPTGADHTGAANVEPAFGGFVVTGFRGPRSTPGPGLAARWRASSSP